MSNKIKNFIKMVQQIKMTEEENESVRANIASYAKNKKIENTPISFRVPSPYFSKFSFSIAVKTVGFALLFVLIGVSGISFASASALPGDLLYPIKIARENFEEKFASSPEQRIALKQKRIETRFSEVETLIKEKKITPENRSIADTKIKEDTAAIGTDLEEINKTDPQAAIDAKTTLDASIEEHQEKIDTLITQQSNDATDANTDQTTTGESDFDGEVNTKPTDPNATPDTNATTPDDNTDNSSLPASDSTTTTDNSDGKQSSSNSSVSHNIEITSGTSGTDSSSTDPVDNNSTKTQ